MRVEELKAHYGTWANMCHELRIGMSTYAHWVKRDAISFPTQLVIERKTDGKFIAREEDAQPRKGKTDGTTKNGNDS